MIVLDTNVISEIAKPRPDPAVVGWLGEQRRDDIFLCAPVAMEQAYGAELFYLRTRSDRHLRILENTMKEFAGRNLAFGDTAALLAGKLRARRGSNGRPLSYGDAMIAAICLVHGASLATRNVRDFDMLELKLVNPFEAKPA